MLLMLNAMIFQPFSSVFGLFAKYAILVERTFTGDLDLFILHLVELLLKKLDVIHAEAFAEKLKYAPPGSI